MKSFKDFPKDFLKPFVFCFDLLARSNLHMDKRGSLLSCNVKLYVKIFCSSCFFIMLTVNMSKVFSGELKFTEIVKSLPIFLVLFQTIVTTAIFIIEKDEIQYLILQLKSMWKSDLTENQLIKKNDLLKKLNFGHAVLYWMNIFGTCQYVLSPIIETLYCRFILLQQCELRFPFACEYPFDPVANWYIYGAVYVFQIYSLLPIVYIYTAIQLLMVTLCAHLTIQFMLLREDLVLIKPSFDKNEKEIASFSKDFGINDIIRRHQKLISLSQVLDRNFNKIIFLKLLLATVIICFFGIVVKYTSGPSDMTVNALGAVASTIPIFILCYYGQLLMEESEGVANSLYNTLWYENGVKSQKILLFVMLRSQKPCRMTSMKYTPITLSTFTKVISTTWSYFNLANSVLSRKD